MTIILDGSSLTVEKLVRIAREGEQVELDPAAVERIKVCRAMLEEKIAAREIMYGTNTGIGEFSEIVLNDEQVKAVPALPDLQPRRRHRRAGADRGRAGRPDRPYQRPRARQLGLPPRDHPDAGGDAQQGRDAGGLPEGVRRRVRRPGPDGPDRAAADGRGRGLLPGRAPAGSGGAGARRHPGARPAGAGRPGGHQRVERADRDVRPALLRRRALAQARPRSRRR